MQSHGSTGTKATIGARNNHCWSSQGWGSTCQSYCQRPLPHGKVQPNLLFFFSILGYLFTLTTIMNKMKNIHSGHLHSCKLLLVILFVYISISRAHIFHVVSIMNNSQNSGWAWSWRVSRYIVLLKWSYAKRTMKNLFIYLDMSEQQWRHHVTSDVRLATLGDICCVDDLFCFTKFCSNCQHILFPSSIYIIDFSHAFWVMKLAVSLRV